MHVRKNAGRRKKIINLQLFDYVQNAGVYRSASWDVFSLVCPDQIL